MIQKRYLKAQFSSVIATSIDFIITIILTEWFHILYLWAHIIGMLCGGYTHFKLSRKWVFKATAGKQQQQAMKYIMVWCLSFILNTLSVWFLTDTLHLNYIASKAISASLLALCINYFLHKKYVFHQPN